MDHQVENIVRRAVQMRSRVFLEDHDHAFHDIPTYYRLETASVYPCPQLIVHGKSGADAVFPLREGLYCRGPL